jgi:hypothetical protein
MTSGKEFEITEVFQRAQVPQACAIKAPIRDFFSSICSQVISFEILDRVARLAKAETTQGAAYFDV